MTFEQEPNLRLATYEAEPSDHVATVYHLAAIARGIPDVTIGRYAEVSETDETYAPVTKGSTAVALAGLVVAIEEFINHNFPGLTLADLRTLATKTSMPHDSLYRVATGD